MTDCPGTVLMAIGGEVGRGMEALSATTSLIVPCRGSKTLYCSGAERFAAAETGCG